MNDGRLAFLITAKNLASKEFKSVNGEIAKMEKQTKGAKTGLGGLLSTVNPTTVAIGGLALGASALTGFLVKSSEMAIAEEKNIAKLGASLKANIPNWDGNTSAIERTIRSGEQLAFSDDEQRDSMAKLVAATHNVAKAQDIMRTGMDLARLKGISLGDATDALTKVEGGQYKLLKSLGIQLKAGATAQDALTAVQKVATGQAAAYASTIEGKMLTAQIKMDDAMENLGQHTLPLVADGMRDVSTALTLLADGQVQGAQAGADLKDTVGDLISVYGVLMAGPLGALAGNFFHNMADDELAAVVATQKLQDHGDKLAGSLDDIIGPAKGAKDGIKGVGDAAKIATPKLSDLASTAADKVAPALDSLFTLPELRGQESDATLRIKDIKDQLAALPAGSSAARTALQGDLASARRDLDATIVKEAALGDKPANDQISKWLTSLGKKTRDLGEDAYYAVTQARVLAGISGGLKGANNPYTKARAGGGPVSGGAPYIVGEAGPELFVPGTSGTIIPNGGSGGSSGSSFGGGGTTVINFNSVWPPTREQAREVARLIDEHNHPVLQRAAVTSGRV